jgi:hypothetical protein
VSADRAWDRVRFLMLTCCCCLGSFDSGHSMLRAPAARPYASRPPLRGAPLAPSPLVMPDPTKDKHLSSTTDELVRCAAAFPDEPGPTSSDLALLQQRGEDACVEVWRLQLVDAPHVPAARVRRGQCQPALHSLLRGGGGGGTRRLRSAQEAAHELNLLALRRVRNRPRRSGVRRVWDRPTDFPKIVREKGRRLPTKVLYTCSAKRWESLGLPLTRTLSLGSSCQWTSV